MPEQDEQRVAEMDMTIRRIGNMPLAEVVAAANKFSIRVDEAWGIAKCEQVLKRELQEMLPKKPVQY